MQRQVGEAGIARRMIGDDARETVIRLTGAPDCELGVGLGLNAWAGHGQDGEIDPGLIHRLQPQVAEFQQPGLELAEPLPVHA
jgi:hypothetical protein